jgi:hypothetical protein
MTKQEYFRKAVIDNDIAFVKALLTEPIFNLNLDKNWAFNYASQNGYTDIIELFLKDKKINITNDNSWAIGLASKNGHVDTVKLLLKESKINPSYDDNCAIIDSYQNNHTIIVLLLWQDTRIKNTLKNDNKELYNKLITKDIKNKVKCFFN